MLIEKKHLEEKLLRKPEEKSQKCADIVQTKKSENQNLLIERIRLQQQRIF